MISLAKFSGLKYLTSYVKSSERVKIKPSTRRSRSTVPA